MTGDAEAYVGRARGLLIWLADRLTAMECGEVEDLIEHGEPAEAMRALAWILVDECKKVPAEAVAALRELTDLAVAPEDMPLGLDDCIEP